MRIAFLTHEPFHPPSGGGSAEAIYLVREMVRRGYEVHVFCPWIEDSNAVTERFDVHLHLFSKWAMGRYASLRNVKYLLYPRELVKMVMTSAEAHRFDLIVSQHTISSVAAGRLRKLLNVPVAMNFLDFLTGFMETWPVWMAPRLLLNRLQRFEITLPSRSLADGVMTVSDPLAEIFASAGFPLTRICPIYYGYDAEKFPIRPAAPAAGKPPIVIMHGSFDQHHLGPIARTAMIELHRQQPDAVFRFVGRQTAGLTKHFDALRTAAPTIRIEATGFVPYDQIAKQLAEATVGIVPYEESNGTHCAFVAKAVEYLGVGLPVVSTRLNNLARYFRDEPRIRFAEFDGVNFAAQILAWLNDPLLDDAESTARAAARVRAQLDWAVISRKAVDFLEKTKHEFR